MDLHLRILRQPLSPELREAARALCAATTPAAACAAALKLDLACMQTYQRRDLSRCTGGPFEQSSLTTALLDGGVSPATLAALLRGPHTRHKFFVSRFLFAASLLERASEPSARVRAKALLSGGLVFNALLDAVLAVAPVAESGGKLAEKPIRVRSADNRGEFVYCPPASSGREVLNDHLFALGVCLQAWPRTSQRFAEAPQRDAVLATLLAHYKPSARHQGEAPGDAPKLHGCIVCVLQNVTNVAARWLVWTPSQAPFRRSLLDALIKGLTAQAEAACAQPASTRFVPREVSDACTVLTNYCSPAVVVPDVDFDTRVAEACAAGLPWVLMELLDERSAMLGAVHGSAANALVMVLRLLRFMLETESGRAALPVHDYGSDGYDDEDAAGEDYASDALLQRFALLAHFHPHAAVLGGAASCAIAAYFLCDRAFSEEPDCGVDRLMLREDASRAVALRLGWDVSRGSNVPVMFETMRAPGDTRGGVVPGATWSTPEDESVTLSGFAVNKVGGLARCAACRREQKHDETPFKVCSVCRAPHYCSKECQRAHWRTAHKHECTGPAAEAVA